MNFTYEELARLNSMIGEALMSDKIKFDEISNSFGNTSIVRVTKQNNSKQVQPVIHKFTRGGVVTIINIVLINGKEVLIEHLTEEERASLKNNLNREALEQKNYIEEKTA